MTKSRRHSAGSASAARPLLLETTAAAAALGIEPRYLRRLAAEHNIGMRYGTMWFFIPSDLELIKPLLKPRGRPPKSGGSPTASS
jgi:hypothetical protein